MRRGTGWVWSVVFVCGLCGGAAWGLPEFVVSPDSLTICEGATAQFSVEVQFNGEANPLIVWTLNDVVVVPDGDRVTIVTNVAIDPATSTLTINDATAADVGTYKCEASSSVGSVSMSADLLFHPPPSTDAQVDFDGTFDGLCVGDSIGLLSNPTGTDPANQFVFWTVESGPDTNIAQILPLGAQDPTFTPTGSGTYVLKAQTSDCGVVAESTVTVEVFAPLAASPTPVDAAVCLADSIDLFANPSGGDGMYMFAWVFTPADDSILFPNEMAENPQFTPAVIGDYQLDVVVSAASLSVVCQQAAPIGVTVSVVSDTLAVTATASAPELCLGADTALTTDVNPGDGSLQYLWTIVSGPDLSLEQFSDTSAADPVFTPFATTDVGMPYELTVFVSGGLCDPGSDSVTVIVNDSPTVAPTATPATVCVGRAATMAANPSGSGSLDVNWSVVSGPDTSDAQFSPFPGAENPTFTPTATGTYVLQVNVDDAFCTESATDTVEVVAADVLAAAPVATPATVCVGTPTSLTTGPSGGGGAYTFFWSIVSAPAGGGAELFVPSNASENPEFTPTVSGTYVLDVVVSSDGCDDSDPQQVTLLATNDLPVVAAASDDMLCLPSVALLTATPNNPLLTYDWTVSIGPVTDPSQFSTPTLPQTLFTPAGFGDYTLQVAIVDASGCGNSTDTVDITVYDTVAVEVSADAEKLCLGDSTTLSLTTGGSGTDNQTLAWTVVGGPDTSDSQFDDVNSASPVFTPSTFTTTGDPYILEVTVFDPSCGGLPSTDAIAISVNEPLSAAPTADPVVQCEQIPVQLSANPSGGDDGNYMFAWANPSNQADPTGGFSDPTAENPTFTPPSAPAAYELTLLIDDGMCESTELVYTVALDVHSPLSVSPSAEFEQAVLGESMLLHANAEGGTDPSFVWSVLDVPDGCTNPLSNATSANPTFLADCAATYTVFLQSDDDVCENVSQTLAVDVILFTAEPSSDPAGLCEGEMSELSANLNDGGAFGQFTYVWSIADGSPDTDVTQFQPNAAVEHPMFAPAATGVYTIVVSADDVNDALPTITGQFDLVVSTAAPTIDTSPVDRTVCAGESVTFGVTASGADLSYQWLLNGQPIAGETEATLAIQSVLFAHAGTYTCAVSNGCATVTSQPAELVVEPALGLSLFVGTREDGLLREAEIVGCTIMADLLDRGVMGTDIVTVTGLAVHPTTGILYAAVRLAPSVPGEESSETHLATVNAVTGEATIIATMGHPISDIAFAPNGTLYAIRGNDPCAACPETGEAGEMFTVDLTDASVMPLTPPIVFGFEEGHTIAFDDNEPDKLYHHGKKNPNVYSRLTRRSLSAPTNVEILRDFDPTVSLTAMTIRGDQFVVAKRSTPSELWTLDHAGGTYAETALGPLDAPGPGNPTVFALAFQCFSSGDSDCDGDTDLSDYALFLACLEDATPAACVAFDGDGDGDVDLADWGIFQAGFTGAGSP